MNNDLIGRKEIIKRIDELGYVNCYDGKDFEANSRVDEIRQRIVEMPIAYDVDKVIEQLEELLWDCYTDNGAGFEVYKNRMTEIVKSGSVADEQF